MSDSRYVHPGDPLSARETEALIRSAQGQKEAAFAMGVGPQTVKNFLTIAYRKLDVTSLAEAYLKLGWLRLPDVAPRPVLRTTAQWRAIA